ncbi:hypothetical protein BGX38DRAFT_1147473 [Terfezia claveryi]|nr:hypothetical protein BGX38DRAFT_1147473 [Terfezia claveryi]
MLGRVGPMKSSSIRYTIKAVYSPARKTHRIARKILNHLTSPLWYKTRSPRLFFRRIPRSSPGNHAFMRVSKGMDERRRWLNKVKDGGEEYSVDLVGTFFSNLDLR